jgi:predicted DCC family thiol-disulfide oxidoreductase YuxK
MSVILFDGYCVLCSRSYRFVTARDRAERFRFVPIQEPEGRELAAAVGVDADNPETFVLIEDGRVFVRSDAALRIGAGLPWWGWVSAFRIVPRPIRDWVYGVVARNRYRWFGKLDVCTLPQRRGGKL